MIQNVHMAGHYGRVCGLCTENKTREGSYFVMGAAGCVECEKASVAGAWVIGAGMIMLALLLYYVAVWRSMSKLSMVEQCLTGVANTLEAAVNSVTKHLPRTMTSDISSSKKDFSLVGYLKVVISFCQVTATFLSNLKVDWPRTLSQVRATNFVLFCLSFARVLSLHTKFLSTSFLSRMTSQNPVNF